jgi:hypothetical protein
MKSKLSSMLLISIFLLTSCSFSYSMAPTPTEPATPTSIFVPSETPVSATQVQPTLPVETFTPVSVPPTATATTVANTSTTAPPVTGNICSDSQVTTLLNSLKTAILTKDGPLLSSLVSPNGMEVRYFRDGTVVEYSPYQAQFLFETDFEVNWGTEPGSGAEKTGAFHDVVVPKLEEVLNTSYTLHCNELKYGGATYNVEWPYDKDFYSIYYEGSDQYGFMDWHTWMAGIEYVNGKPYLYALMQFFWEP